MIPIENTNGITVWISVEHIVYIWRDSKDTTQVNMSDGNSFITRMTPQEIMQKFDA